MVPPPASGPVVVVALWAQPDGASVAVALLRGYFLAAALPEAGTPLLRRSRRWQLHCCAPFKQRLRGRVAPLVEEEEEGGSRPGAPVAGPLLLSADQDARGGGGRSSSCLAGPQARRRRCRAGGPEKEQVGDPPGGPGVVATASGLEPVQLSFSPTGGSS